MRKFIKIRYIVIMLLVLLLGITSIVYFAGGLTASALDYNLIPFSEEGFYLPNEAELNKDKLVSSNERFEMYFDETTTIVTIYDKENDKVYHTAQKDSTNPRLLTPFNIEFYDIQSVSGSVDRMNAYENSILYEDELTEKKERHYKIKYDTNSVQILYEIGKFGVTSEWFPQLLSEQRFRQLFIGNLNSEECIIAREDYAAGDIDDWELEDICYTNPFLSKEQRARANEYYARETITDETTGEKTSLYSLTRSTAIVKTNLYNMLYRVDEKGYGGYQAFDEKGKPMWEKDSRGNYVLDEDENRIPIRALYTREEAAADNAANNIVAQFNSPKFQVAIEYKLTSNGLEANIIRNSIKEGDDFETNFFLTNIDFLPNFTQVAKTDTEKGYMVVPDGSGALIYFNNDKFGHAVYNKGIYGSDLSYYPNYKPEEEQKLMFPMFGFIDHTNEKGILAIMEEGASLGRIVADVPRTETPNNKINFRAALRSNEVVRVGVGFNAQTFTKWSRSIPKVDLRYRFDILGKDELSYSSLANKYRDYLIEKYGLQENDNSKKTMVNVNLLGAFEQYNLFLGFKYKELASLTTFSQAKEIVKELQEFGVNDINLLYTSWTEDAFENTLRKNNKVAKVLGGKKEFNNLSSFLQENNIDFYPESHFASTKGYDLAFGKMKYTSRSISSSYAEHYKYNLATLHPEKSLGSTFYISPGYYQAASKILLNSYNKLNINGLMVNDLGNIKIANYSKSANITVEDGLKYQVNTLKDIKSQIDKTLLKAPFDYAFAYTNTAVDVPIVSSLYGLFDETIPLYQLVANGLFDYAGLSVNGNYQNKDWFLLKAIETGSNLYYELSYENPEILLNTNYNQYFYTYYKNWTSEIASMAAKLDELGIHGGRLINHEIIDSNVVKVTYSNGIEIIVNNSLNDFVYQGILIQSNRYQKVNG